MAGYVKIIYITRGLIVSLGASQLAPQYLSNDPPRGRRTLLTPLLQLRQPREPRSLLPAPVPGRRKEAHPPMEHRMLRPRNPAM